MIGDSQLWFDTGSREQVRGGSWVANTKQWGVRSEDSIDKFRGGRKMKI